MPVTFVQKGNFKKANSFLEKLRNIFKSGILDKYGKEGVAALAEATPVDTGKTASKWGYKIERHKDDFTLVWYNTNQNKGYSIAALIQYGHIVYLYGSKEYGVYKKGINYINPAIKPIMSNLVKEIEKEVKR